MAFGAFRLLRTERVLLEGERVLRLGSRAIAILIALVERAGQVVGKDELLAIVWPDTFVEEANLRVHIAAIRKVLGDGRAGARFIVNEPGRGYSFVAPLETPVEPPGRVNPSTSPVEHLNNLPAPLTRLVGRAIEVAALALQVRRHRFVTVVGPGGVGKSTVALAAAGQLLPDYPDGAYFVDLAAGSDAQHLPTALASALGLAVASSDPLPNLIGFLADRRMLLVFDNCEHVVAATAVLAEALLKGAPHVGILLTSREPLRAEGEWLHRLSPMPFPLDPGPLTAATALAFPSVQLFAARASEVSDGFVLTDAEAPMVGDLCRRLEGLPLAIELAAARIAAFGVRGLLERLDSRFLLLTQGRRTAPLRHQTMRGVLDWSYGLLSESERLVLRRLAVFKGAFALQSAVAIAFDETARTMGGAAVDDTPVLDSVASLA